MLRDLSIKNVLLSWNPNINNVILQLSLPIATTMMVTITITKTKIKSTSIATTIDKKTSNVSDLLLLLHFVFSLLTPALEASSLALKSDTHVVAQPPSPPKHKGTSHGSNWS